MKWKILSLPAEAKEGDLLGRAPGESLFPERLSADRIKELKSADIGTWLTLFQQEEMREVDRWFDPQQLRYWKHLDPGLLNRYILVDPANSKKSTADYTTIFVFGVGEDHNYYWLEMIRDRLNPSERIQTIIGLHRKWKPLKVGYEEYGMVADTFHINEEMNRKNYRFSLLSLGKIGPHRALSKPDRIRGLLPILRSSQFWMPEHQTTKLLSKESVDMVEVFLETELKKYPNCSHDDMLDVISRLTDPELKIEYPLPQEEEISSSKTNEGRTWASG